MMNSAIIAETNTQDNMSSSITAVKFTNSFSTVENSGKTPLALRHHETSLKGSFLVLCYVDLLDQKIRTKKPKTKSPKLLGLH